MTSETIVKEEKRIMNTPKACTIAILPIMVTLALFTGSACGIKGNFQPDSTPYVGVVVLFSDADKTQPIGYCSGFLISPTVMLTAGHSLVGAEATSVCFDKGPINFAIENGQIVYYGTNTVYDGIPVSYPEYYPTLAGNQEFATSDIGIIILNQPVDGITTFPALPTLGFADTLKIKTDLLVVGYGFQYQVTPRNDGVVNSWTGTVSRNTAQVQLLSSNFNGGDIYLKLTANPGQGKGGVSFGDSGGPVICTTNGQDIVLAVNAYVSSVNCGGVSYHTRIDTQQVIDWINGYLS
jgi:hypothetical protein